MIAELTSTEREMLAEDVFDMLSQVKSGRLTVTDLVTGLRRSGRSYVEPKSNRRWRFENNFEALRRVESTGLFAVVEGSNERGNRGRFVVLK